MIRQINIAIITFAVIDYKTRSVPRPSGYNSSPPRWDSDFASRLYHEGFVVQESVSGQYFLGVLFSQISLRRAASSIVTSSMCFGASDLFNRYYCMPWTFIKGTAIELILYTVWRVKNMISDNFHFFSGDRLKVYQLISSPCMFWVLRRS